MQCSTAAASGSPACPCPPPNGWPNWWRRGSTIWRRLRPQSWTCWPSANLWRSICWKASPAIKPLKKLSGKGLSSDAESGRRCDFRLSHPLYADVRRQRMPRAKARRLSSTLAEALQATGARRRDDIVRVAGWRLGAGERGDPELLTLAAASARQLFNMELAARLARAALESGGGVRAGLALGEAEFYSGRPEEAERVLSGLVPVCADDEETARVASARSYNLAFLMGDKAGAEMVVAEALSAITEPMPSLRLTARLAIIRVYGGEPRLALGDAQMLASCSEDAISHRGMAIASIALALLGRTDEGVRMAQQGLEVHRRCSDRTQAPESQYIGSVLAHLAAGRLDQADAEASIGYEAAVRAGDHDGLATFCLLAGMVHVEQGRLSEALKRFLEGRSTQRGTPRPRHAQVVCGRSGASRGHVGPPLGGPSSSGTGEVAPTLVMEPRRQPGGQGPGLGEGGGRRGICSKSHTP